MGRHQYAKVVLITLFLISLSTISSATEDVCEIETGDFCSQTQGGWGSVCSGDNPGCLRDNNWDTVIDGNLVVGIGFSLTFTAPDSVEEFLPQGKPAAPLTQNYVDPPSTNISVFAGQVTALKMNVLFSDAGIGLVTPGDIPLGELIIGSGAFEDLTVYELLELAETVLGGDVNALLPYSATISSLNDAVTSVNENFVDCETDEGFLEKICEEEPFCGDGVVDEGEFCDDGNNENNDGCSATCELEQVVCEFGEPVLIDFNELETGQVVDDEYSGLGLAISAVNDNENHPDKAIIFDSSNPSGSDFDLGTPNELFGGPGIGFGGGAGAGNNLDMNNLLIIAEDDVDGNNDGLVDDPDDERAGGELIFEFTNTITLHSMGIVDLEESGGTIKAFDSNGTTVLNYSIPDLGDNSFQRFFDDASDYDAVKVEVHFPSSGGISDLTYCSTEPDPFCGDGEVNQESEVCDGEDGTPTGYICNEFCELERLPFCGDGVVNQESEECDGEDGTPEGFVCTEQCTLEELPFCGDGVVNQESEVCDGEDGVPEGYVCTQFCDLERLPFCGDGFVNQESEVCDGTDGVPEGYVCTEICELERLPFCGDGVINQESEVCDGDDGVGPHQTCSETCELEELTFCGDDVKQTPNDELTGGPLDDGFEECDGQDGTPEHFVCLETCELEYVPFCGDGIVNQESEQCDGDAGVGTHQTCSETCELDSLTFCGDDIKQSPNDELTGGPLNDGFEECDGEDGTPEHFVCLQSCELEYVPFCGDDIVNQESEQCDGEDGVGPHQTCSETCELEELTFCGDDIKQSPNDELTGGPLDNGFEECDGEDGTPEHFVCLETCELEYVPFCGDGEINQESEQCDGDDGVGPHQTCSETCELEELTFCGDDVKQSPNDELTGGPLDDGFEECDGQDGTPEHYTCLETCELEYIPYCGDGIVNQESETCDGEDGVPEGFVCTETCELERLPFCGDGEVNQESEVCDDGNNENDDGCSATCELECTPEFHKTIYDPNYGVCPPAPESEDACYINLDTTIDIEITYENEICVDNNVNCQWGYTLDQNQFFGWFTEFPIQFPEETEHELIITCTDRYGNEIEDIERFFVDDTPPETIKIVHEPFTIWDGQDSIFYPQIGELCWNEDENVSIDCWKVTLATPITLACDDPDPHPVDNSSIFFMVELDADTATESYCKFYGGDFNVNGNGWCNLNTDYVDFFFLEETEHNLKFYCEDALGNQSEIDDEKFKVEGDDFEIVLIKKWNLISIPFTLKDNNISVVLKDVIGEVDSVWSYNPFTDEWKTFRPSMPEASNLFTIDPGKGYWIAMLDENVLLLGGSLFSPIVTPPSEPIKEGWNLIGYYGTDGVSIYDGPHGHGREAQCALFSLGDTFIDKGWSALMTYWEPDNPNEWHNYGYFDNLDPGAGYWLFATQDGEYVFSTTCFGG